MTSVFLVSCSFVKFEYRGGGEEGERKSSEGETERGKGKDGEGGEVIWGKRV